MSFRETAGFMLIIVGLLMVPVAWMFSRTLWFAAFVLVTLGMLLFYTERIERKAGASETEHGGRPLPSDINDYTGWSSGGGHSESMDGD